MTSVEPSIDFQNCEHVHDDNADIHMVAPKVFFDLQMVGDMRLDWDSIAKCLMSKNPFCFNMFNDGEMSIIACAEKAVASRGSQQGSASLAMALSEALHFRAKNYFVGIPCGLCYPNPRQEALDICGQGQSHITLANLLINDNYVKTLALLQGALYRRNTVFVISDKANMSLVEQMGITVTNVIKVPDKDAWSDFEQISNKIKEALSPLCVLILCCGPLGRVLAYEHYRADASITCIELGSFFDPWTQNKSYLYHQNLLPVCDICNKTTLDQRTKQADSDQTLIRAQTFLEDQLKKNTSKEHFTLQNYDQFYQLFKGDINRMERMYSLLLDTYSDFNSRFYCLWSIARCKKDLGMPFEVIESAYMKCFHEFSWRAEPLWDFITSVLTEKSSKHRFELLCKLENVQCPNPEVCISVDPSLYTWRILDEITHQAYHVNEYDIGFAAMKNLLKKNEYPESERDRIRANSEFYYKHMSEKAKYIQFKSEIQQLAQKVSADQAKNIVTGMSGLPPLYLHFVCLETDKFQFDMISYIAVRSAYEVNQPTRVFVFTDKESESIWWLKMKKISDRIVVILITKPTTLNDHPIWAPQHQCDIMRINILNEIGGVYFDLDALSIKPVRDLISRFQDKIVMAKETDKGLCNCVIIAPAKSSFMTNWVHAYETSYGTVEDHWVGLSVRKPLELAQAHREEIVQMPQETFIPHLYCDYSMFDDTKDCLSDLKNSYTCHLYTTELYKNPSLVPTNSDYMYQRSNTFAKLFQKYIDAC